MVVVALSLQQVPLDALLQVEVEETLDMPTAISAVVGAAIVGVVLTPDLTRYARNDADCVTASFIGQGCGMSIAYLCGMIPVMAWGELEPMTYMFMAGFGVVALLVLVFATWTTNVINIYSTALAVRASVPFGHYPSVVVLMGIVGTAAALIGISENLIEFLVVMGLLVPPIAGVYLADFFWFGRRDFSPEALDSRPAIRTNAVVVGLGIGVLSAWLYYSDRSLTSIGALDSLFLSVVAYVALQRLTGRRRP